MIQESCGEAGIKAVTDGRDGLYTQEAKLVELGSDWGRGGLQVKENPMMTPSFLVSTLFSLFCSFLLL